MFTFRLTDSNKEMLEAFVVWARSTSVVHMVVFEISKDGQEHIHMLFDPIKVTKSAWVQAFHKHFKNRWNGNKSYSCSELRKEKENFLIYMCKGTRYKLPEILFKLGDYTDQDVETYWKKYWEDKPVEKDKTLNVKPSKKALTWSQELTNAIRKEYPNHNWSYDTPDLDLLFNYVMKALGSASKKLNAFIVRDLVLGQLNALTAGECLGLNQDLKKQAFPNFFGNV